MTIETIAPLAPGNPDDPFWNAWKANERFLLHRCAKCGRSDWPATCCPDHGLAPMAWVESTGEGTVDTFTIFYRAYTQALAGEVPYVLAVVRLDEGPYFHTRIVDIAPEAVRTNLRVRVRRGKGDSFPLFAPIPAVTT